TLLLRPLPRGVVFARQVLITAPILLLKVGINSTPHAGIMDQIHVQRSIFNLLSPICSRQDTLGIVRGYQESIQLSGAYATRQTSWRASGKKGAMGRAK